MLTKVKVSLVIGVTEAGRQTLLELLLALRLYSNKESHKVRTNLQYVDIGKIPKAGHYCASHAEAPNTFARTKLPSPLRASLSAARSIADYQRWLRQPFVLCFL